MHFKLNRIKFLGNFARIIFFNKFIIRLLCALIPSKGVRNFLRSRVVTFDGIVLLFKLKEKYKDYWVFFSMGGLGELIESAVLLKDFRQKKSGKILFIVDSTAKKDVITLFDSVDEVLLVSKSEYLGLSGFIPKRNGVPLSPELSCKSDIIPVFHYKSLIPYGSKDGKKSMMEAVSAYLKVDDSYNIDRPQISEELKTKAKNTFRELNLIAGKTVLIAPFANSYNSDFITPEMWTKLADKMVYDGYEVIFNSPKSIFGRHKTIMLPVDETVAIADMCSHIICFRSGFSEVMAVFANPKMLVVYPGNNIKMYLNQGNNGNSNGLSMSALAVMQYSSLKTMFGKTNVVEVLFEGDELELSEYFSGFFEYQTVFHRYDV